MASLANTALFTGLDPLSWTYFRLPIASLYTGRKQDATAVGDDDLWSVSVAGRLVKAAEVTGMVVQVARRARHTQYLIDDGTGLLPVVCWLPDGVVDADADPDAPRVLGLGESVVARGRLSSFRGDLQMVADSVYASSDPHAEALSWLVATQLTVERYTKSFEPAQVLAPDLLAAAAELASRPPPALGREMDREQGAVDEGGEASGDEPPRDPQAVFADAVLGAIAATGTRSYAELRRLPELNAAAQVALAAVPSTVEAATRLKSLFVRTLARLVSDGLIFLQDEDADVYEAISVSRNLGPALLALVADARNHDVRPGDGSVSGVTASALVNLIAASPSFCNVARSRVFDAIAVLVDESYIFESAPRVYAAL
ncbi:OB-fold nucleic acid binding domain-containing protein [Thecamonas trahens ATCC 50062]|uniref:CST complex subunit STN1 n=1 Tax=Thecamonas trahens ATCC 50062 TaxID=461836 RepID=A0A0L0D9R1_THETB|nr:OB-fold nucleic acid binding domain-containing protein [Thecamonas trahens ATCC 50062]KNC48826.1 OB-fold nucleic acid binding domain-containing protein [Thecamonas trahens ATCC 50062]|eukprot:XP_013758246.1 OB-fold nucleic acid binding domain-containing protein [Thecamonas trahens ATCC 50062]